MERLDLLIIGAGPAGLSAADAAAREGLSYVVIEKGTIANTIRQYPVGRRPGVTVLTSPSRDGEIIAQVAHRFGMSAARGSSSRKGSQALLELIRRVESGGDIAITPDGPRGPRYKLGPGAVLLAQTTGAVLAPVHATYSRCLRMKTWDGFIIPLPFSTVSVTVDEMIPVPRELTKEEFEALRLRLETQLKNATD